MELKFIQVYTSLHGDFHCKIGLLLALWNISAELPLYGIIICSSAHTFNVKRKGK